jgi:TatD-related deoxyribonuclease
VACKTKRKSVFVSQAVLLLAWRRIYKFSYQERAIRGTYLYPTEQDELFMEYITDNHIHIDPYHGIGIEAAKRFKRGGGTCLFLVNKMAGDAKSPVRKLSDFEEAFEKTISLKDRIARETDLIVFAVIGVHPAEHVFLCKKHGLEKALEISIPATELAGEKISLGGATALGEMGRPHFDVDPEILESSNKLLLHAMSVAKDLDCAFGFVPSVLASRENVLSSLKGGGGFLMESDYIDDLKRPGAVLGPKSVPRITLKLLQEGLMRDEDAIKIHRENVERTYGVSMEM